MVLAIVPEAPPAWKNSRATSCPAPISANVPYFGTSRLMVSAFWLVVRSSFCSLMPPHWAPWNGDAIRSCVTSLRLCFLLVEGPKAGKLNPLHEEFHHLDAGRPGGPRDFLGRRVPALHRTHRSHRG